MRMVLGATTNILVAVVAVGLVLLAQLSTALSVNSAAGARTCELDDVVEWGGCFFTLRSNVNTSAAVSQADWDVADSENRTLIEASYYCLSAKNALVIAARCIPVCSQDNVDYFGRDQLLTYCQNSLDVEAFANIPNFETAQVTYSCSDVPLTCADVINQELQKSLNEDSPATMAYLNPNIVLALLAIALLAI